MGKKKIIICLLLVLCLTQFFCGKTAYADQSQVYLGGMPAGFTLLTKGAHIVGIGDVITENGNLSPAKSADLRVGDIIYAIDGKEINNAIDMERVIGDSKEIVVSIERFGENIIKTVYPIKDLSGKMRLGVFVKDNVNGIGTVTFINNGRFASLGHPILDDSGKILSIRTGTVYNCQITGVIKGERGAPGELRGVFAKGKTVAKIDKNCSNGVYGNIEEDFDFTGLKKIKVGAAKLGNAKIYTTINGCEPIEYSISIIKADYDRDNRNFVIKINDKRILDVTGGIVQGMSGSPILQGDRLVGAVTHVFTNDPTRGFGISIDNMLNN